MSNALHTVFLRGGLGNQFFQWLYALRLQEQGIDVVLDDSFIRPIVGNQAAGFTELSNVFRDLRVPIESRWKFLRRFEGLFVRIAYFMGLLQIERKVGFFGVKPMLHYGYYQEIDVPSDFIRHVIFDGLHPSFYCESHADFPRILLGRKYIAVHVRGGDYKGNEYNFQEIGVLSVDYYKRALSSLAGPDMPIVVVSDDDVRARQVFNEIDTNNRCILFLSDISEKSGNPLLALSVLLSSELVVCANSSFSAMGVYLNPNDSAVVPSPWFRGVTLAGFSPTRRYWKQVVSVFVQTRSEF